MVFKTIMKKSSRQLPKRTVSITRVGRVNFSRDLQLLINKFKAMEVMVDLDYNKLAFKPSNDLERGYKLITNEREGKKTTLQFQSLYLVNGEIKGTFKVRWTEGMIIFDDINVDKLKDIDFFEDGS